MQFTVERDVFLAELSRITGVIENRNTIPICGHVRVDAGHGGLILRATNLEMEAETICAADVSKTGLTTVNGKLLADFVKRCPEGETIAVSANAGKLRFACGRIKSTFPTLPAEDFPVFQAVESGVSFPIAAKSLRRLIERTRFAVATHLTLHYLHGSYLHADDDHLVACAATMPRPPNI